MGQYLKDSPKINNVGKNEEPVNEVLLTLIAASVLAYTCQPLLNTEFMKSIGGGLGMIAISYGYQRFNNDIVWVCVVLTVIIVQLIQEAGLKIAKLTDKRRTLK